MGNELKKIFDCDAEVVLTWQLVEDIKEQLKKAKEANEEAIMQLHRAIEEARNPSLAFKDDSEKVSKKAASKGK